LPTRERSGWTGDIQVFAPAAAEFVDAQAFLRRYVHNAAAEQRPDGLVPNVIPDETRNGRGASRLVRMLNGSAGWGDAIVLLPYTLYWYYGDRPVLERLWPNMRAWVDYLEHRASRRPLGRRVFGRRDATIDPYVIEKGFDFGDWLRPGDSFSDLVAVNVRPREVATAYFEHSARVLAAAAGVLGRDDDQIRYAALADRVRAA
jgi:alpha-L-rhamnosidase